ncbi:MAG: lipoprotein releasing system transmembrane protein LolC [Candidatus Scalindua brodae]|uniref:Lipoprotein releasing system transmembrane protein LolC n=1 Tax=Candidatus Scalindua brodae TaxID=237368 RepID=A0A0B0EHM1_9BACT|nr:MAG: lipoprotein releasing system transmembrane protein LolC [Candidatus Scalindua brodae]
MIPDTKKKVSTIYKKVKEGTFLTESSDKGIILGIRLAENLNVGLDEKIVIMSQALDGSIAAGAFHVKGLFDTGTEEIDKGVVIITHKAAEELFVMHDKTSEIAIRLKNVEDAQKVSTLIRQKLNSSELEILPWQEVSTVLEQWIEFDNGFIYLIVIVVMIVVAIGILNTVLMGVLERTREFGILLALGTKRKQILAMVAWESLFLGVIGSLFGSLLGILLTLQLGKTGINLSMFSSALTSFYMDPYIYPVSKTDHIIISIALVLVTSILVSIYPAWHAANLKPVEAIRSI